MTDFSIEDAKPAELVALINLILYGDPGVGKTTFALQAPNPIVIRTEDGLGNSGAQTFPICQSWDDFKSQMKVLAKEEHSFKTLVIDSLDHLEPLIIAAVLAENNKETLNFDFGEGYRQVTVKWQLALNMLSYLRKKRGMHTIMIAHSQKRKQEDPGMEAYDKTMLKLTRQGQSLLIESVDMVLYAHFYRRLQQEGDGKNVRYFMADSDRRVLSTIDTGSALAKNRFNLPAQLPLDWHQLVAAIESGKPTES